MVKQVTATKTLAELKAGVLFFKRMFLKSVFFTSALVTSALISYAPSVTAASENTDALAKNVGKSLSQLQSANQQGERSQQKITKLHEQTQGMLEDYRASLRSLADYRSNNAHLREMQERQTEHQADLARQLEVLADTETAIIPMLKNMIDDLALSIAADMPFLLAERQQRIAGLRETLLDPEQSLPQKYRQVLDAYEIERDFGYTLETYPQDIDLAGQSTLVQVLRLGRIGLYYQSSDGLAQGYWDRDQGAWQPLTSYVEAIDKGIAMAQEQAVPVLLNLPLQAQSRLAQSMAAEPSADQNAANIGDK